MPAARALLPALLCAGFPAWAAPEADHVPQLPGWGAAPLSRTYAGYIPAGEEDGRTMYEHYLFFESEGDPAKDPLIMWTNGGPGASSFLGAFSELGPYYLSDESLGTEEYRATGVPTLFENPHRWTQLGSLLVRNLPPPVGFSYCEPAGPSGDGHSCGSWNDTKTAKHSLAFLQNWMAAFPEFAARELFLAGESYAGLYVPMLAREILAAGPGGLAAQLRGIAVGDGCLGGGGGGGGCMPHQGPLFEVEFFHGHGQFSDATYAEIQRACPRAELLDGVRSPACAAALDRMDREKGYSFAYNLYDECYDFALADARSWREPRAWWGPPRRAAGRPAAMEGSGPGADFHMDGAPCGGTVVLPRWVNASAVRRALHVAPDARFFTGDNGEGFVYNLTEPSLAPWYRAVAREARLRVLVYNGDADPGLNSFYAQSWTAELGLPVLEPWRPWTHDGRTHMGGYVTRYVHDLDFVTIRGAGHMVPEYKPEAAFVMLRAFLRGEDYPRLRLPGPHAAPPSRSSEAVVV